MSQKSKLTDKQLAKMTLPELEEKLKTSKSFDEKNRLEKFKEQKQKENVRVYGSDLDEEYLSNPKYLEKIRTDVSGKAGQTKQTTPSSKPKPPPPFLKPKI